VNGLDYMLFAIIADSTGDDGTNERFGYVDAAHVAKMKGYYTDDSFDTFLSLRLSGLGAIMAVLPLTPGAVIGIPMSLWALAILTQKDVRIALGDGQENNAEMQPRPDRSGT
jgi:hypothetical protein